MQAMLASMWNGAKLRCPRCGAGGMYDGRRAREACPRCQWRFHRLGDGDWLVTWIFAYTLGAVVMVVAVVSLHLFTALDLTTELVVCALLGAGVVAASFRHCKGMAAGLLYFLRVHWRE